MKILTVCTGIYVAVPWLRDTSRDFQADPFTTVYRQRHMLLPKSATEFAILASPGKRDRYIRPQCPALMDRSKQQRYDPVWSHPTQNGYFLLIVQYIKGI
jgi:hypothetical protein